MRIGLIAIFLLTVFSTFVLAQDSQPVVGSEATDLQKLITEVSKPEGEKVLIIGDSLAGGMGAGLTRMAADDQTLEVVNRFNETSGLARPEIYDWAQAIGPMMDGKDFTAAIVLIGMNDRRDMKTDAAKLAYGTPEWDVAYKARVDALLEELKGRNVKIFWMGEPLMGDALYDSDMQKITALQKERVAAKGATFIDLRTPFAGPDGKYTDRGLDDTGSPRRLRESDGVTFFKQGNNRLGQIALAALKANAPTVTTAAAPPAEVAPLPQIIATPDTAKADQSPLFGQEDANGLAISHNGSEVALSVAAGAKAQQAVADSSIGLAAKPGSAAEQLFTTGQSPPPPSGRFDDFKLAAP